MKTLCKLIGLGLASLLFSVSATAGHLFTQASTNSPILVNAGQGVIVPQNNFEFSSGNAGLVTLNLSGWDAGDALKLTIAGYTQTLSFNSPLAGTSQSSTNLNVTDPVLTGLALDLTAPINWTFQATAGSFTWTGYRIYTGNETLDGTNAGLLNQSQVISIAGGNVSISGPILETSRQAVSEGMDSIQLRLEQLRSRLIVNVAPTTINDDSASHDEDPTHHSGMSSGDDIPIDNFWIRAFGAKADRNAKGTFAGYDSDTQGLSLGIDTMLSSGWLVGGAFSYADSSIDFTDHLNGDNADIETYQLTVYATRDFKTDNRYIKNWYLEAMLAYADQDYSVQQGIGGGIFADGDFDGEQIALRVVAGAPIEAAGLTITPFVGMEATHVKQDSLTISSGGMSVARISYDSDNLLRSILGAKARKPVTLKDGSVIEPSVHLTWLHEFNNEGIDYHTITLGGGGGPVLTEGQNIVEDLVVMGAGLTFAYNENLSLSLEVDLQRGSGYSGHAGQIAGVWRF